MSISTKTAWTMHSVQNSHDLANGLPPNGLPPKRKPSRLVRAITNPNEVVAALIPKPREQDPNAKRLEDFRFARALGGMGLDYGIGEPDRARELPPAATPLFPVEIDKSIEDKLPRGYNMRSLQRADYDRGYTRLRAVGPISQQAWDERCEYLRTRADMYTILVVTDNNDQVVATGTLLLERKLTNSMSLVGHIEDLAVGEGQSGKNLGLRILDQLDRLANDFGCARTVLGTQESNEAFYKQRGYRKTGTEMTHAHAPSMKRMPSAGPRTAQAEAKSGNASPERIERERAWASARLGEPWNGMPKQQPEDYF
ncbi:glucosamine 6-phosphate N-acetyltransferase [Lecanosticta acicola]|uniref:Glucosamine 6-phosphate N-acetyltransferase n=1 Tax=Lecanosticta acicola TaxID=111012 RepID=A0AAI9EG26_9PEZI|nr:glucosamine 6-phosphate N-acetyltransferase [Lecanosticta acicola]